MLEEVSKLIDLVYFFMIVWVLKTGRKATLNKIHNEVRE